MKPFIFQKFSINQSKDVFRVGTDGVLLGALSTISTAKNILEIGTGTGLVSLMLAQRNPNSQILALDINPIAVELSSKNFSESIFNKRLKAIHQDFSEFSSQEKFDLIISNPPYFEASDSEKDKLARQTIALNFSQLIEKSAEFIDSKGLFTVIIPFDSGENFIQLAQKNQFHLIRKVIIYGIKNSTPKRLLLEFSREKSDYKEENFVIEKSPRQYSDSYLELTKEFHVFKK